MGMELIVASALGMGIHFIGGRVWRRSVHNYYAPIGWAGQDSQDARSEVRNSIGSST